LYISSRFRRNWSIFLQRPTNQMVNKSKNKTQGSSNRQLIEPDVCDVSGCGRMTSHCNSLRRRPKVCLHFAKVIFADIWFRCKFYILLGVLFVAPHRWPWNVVYLGHICTANLRCVQIAWICVGHILHYFCKYNSVWPKTTNDSL
jgi:hypothetical protein